MAMKKTRTKRGPTLATVLASLKVEEAVRRDLEKIGEKNRDIATGALAANALQLAREMDQKNSATSKSMCARALNETMEKIRALLPPEAKRDGIDQLAEIRARRRAAVTA